MNFRSVVHVWLLSALVVLALAPGLRAQGQATTKPKSNKEQSNSKKPAGPPANNPAKKPGKNPGKIPGPKPPKRILHSEFGRTPVIGDDDGDGLTDAEELLLGTDPNNIDSDGDALLDGWEVHGVNGIDLPAMGANVFHKDIFVEMDYMTRASAANGLGPNPRVLREIFLVFAEAMVSNPDGKRGIHIHLIQGNEIPHVPDMNPVDDHFERLKRRHFDSQKAPVFHYMIWADQSNGTRSSGNAFATPNSDFVVTLGAWNKGNGGTDGQKVGTFIHELGHNLGLMHGGSDPHFDKPNHISVMNYSFQTRGILVNKKRRFDYQRFQLPTLDELKISEQYGLGSGSAIRGYHTIVRGREVPAFGPIDWNDNKKIDAGFIRAQLNEQDYLTTFWHTPNEWERLIYNGGSIGTRKKIAQMMLHMDRVREVLPIELTEEMDIARR